jgi:hypothetical protein
MLAKDCGDHHFHKLAAGLATEACSSFVYAYLLSPRGPLLHADGQGPIYLGTQKIIPDFDDLINQMFTHPSFIDLDLPFFYDEVTVSDRFDEWLMLSVINWAKSPSSEKAIRIAGMPREGPLFSELKEKAGTYESGAEQYGSLTRILWHSLAGSNAIEKSIQDLPADFADFKLLFAMSTDLVPIIMKIGEMFAEAIPADPGFMPYDVLARNGEGSDLWDLYKIKYSGQIMNQNP